LIAAALFSRYQSGYAIAWYVLFCGVLSIVSASLISDYTNKDVSDEHHLPDHSDARHAPA